MAKPDDEVLEALHNQGERLLVDDLVEIVERHHDTDGPGVPRDLVDDYIEALAEDEAFEVGPMREQLDEHVTESRTAADTNAVYDVGDGRVSAYPLEWHEQLDDDATLDDYVAVMTHTAGETPESAASQGVAKDGLLDAATAIGGMSRQEARDQLKDLRANDVLVSDADQHPRAGVSLAEDTDVEKDDLDKPSKRDRSSE